MSNEKKIILLKKLMWKNFSRNFGSRYTIGLCSLWKMVAPRAHKLHLEIPEIVPKFKDDIDIFYYWWEHNGYFKPWWERHKAIHKTIKQLK